MKKILVVDDDLDILQVIQLILSEGGYACEGILRGEDVYVNVGKSAPSLIILDILLSGTDGRTICRNLKNAKKTKNIPIIMMSAHPTAKQSALESGADDFIAKPFSIDDIHEKVKKYIG